MPSSRRTALSRPSWQYASLGTATDGDPTRWWAGQNVDDIYAQARTKVLVSEMQVEGSRSRYRHPSPIFRVSFIIKFDREHPCALCEGLCARVEEG